jgi:hypothetical protein
MKAPTDARRKAGERIVTFVMATLPDSLEARRARLDDLLLIVDLIAPDPVVEDVRNCSAALSQHLNYQREFHFPDGSTKP